MKKLLLFAFLPFCSVMANAQQTNIASQKITGKVKESAAKNAEFASVSLLKSKDSSSVKGMTTTENGQYEFLNVNNGSYLIVVNGVGVKPAYSQAFILDGSVSEFKVADIYLTTTTKSLKEVTVVGTKPFVEQKLDKMVLNVENSVLAAGETAMEVLEKAPGITVDKDDNLSLKGKQGVIVMVDGKPTSLSSTELGAMLRNMPSNNIAQIEVITNPSAKYDAAGNSGIINIKTKKNKQVGLNGSLTTGLGYSQFSKYNGGLNLNYRNNKFNFFGNYNYGYNPRTQILNLERIVTKEHVTIFNQLSDGKRKNYNNTFKVGVDYFINKNNTLGFMVNGFTNTRKSTDLNNTKIMNQDYLLDSSLNVTSLSERNSNNLAYNFNYKSTLDTSGQELTVDFDYSRFEGLSEDNRDNFYLKANAEELRTPKFIQNVAPTDIDIKSVKVDYTLPLNKKSKLEAGIKSSFAKTDNDYKFYRSINKQEWISDLAITNHFIYKENINAAYLNYNTTLGKTSIQLGLRAEQTFSNGNSITKNQVVDTSYTQLFPSVFISQKLSKKHEMGLSYSRRIDRPDYEDLNPFLNFLDEYTYQQGNPYLRPQFTNSFEVSHTYNGKLITTLGYSHIKDVMITITEQDDNTKTTKAIEKNLNRQVSYSLGISTPLNITKWWSSVNNFQSFYLGFKDGDDLDAGEIAFQLNTNHNFILPDGYRAELSAQYQSPLAYGIFKIDAKYRLDAGIQKSFLNKKASLKLSVSDILNTQRERISTTYQNMNLHLDQRRDSQQAKLTLTYRFGKTDFKPRQRKSGSEDEQSRIKSGG